MRHLVLFTALLGSACAAGNDPEASYAFSYDGPVEASEAPVEFGRVAWERDFSAGLAQAKQADKPVLLVFQEVPG